MGVAGGGGRRSHVILLTGVAGLFAGACAMALGEWLSVTNAREMAARQIDQQIENAHATSCAGRQGTGADLRGQRDDRGAVLDVPPRRSCPTSHPLWRRWCAKRFGIEPAHLGANPVSAGSVSFVALCVGRKRAPAAVFRARHTRSGIIASIGASSDRVFVHAWTCNVFFQRPLASSSSWCATGRLSARRPGLITYLRRTYIRDHGRLSGCEPSSECQVRPISRHGPRQRLAGRPALGTRRAVGLVCQ